MARDRALRQIERSHQIADADLLLTQQGKEPQTGGIGQGAESMLGKNGAHGRKHIRPGEYRSPQAR